MEMEREAGATKGPVSTHGKLEERQWEVAELRTS